MRFWTKVILAAIIMLLPFAVCLPASAADIIVTNLDDSGAGSSNSPSPANSSTGSASVAPSAGGRHQPGE